MVFLKLATLASHTCMWVSTAVIESKATCEDDIYITLPVFIISLIATVGFTWTIAKYDNARKRQIDELKQACKELKEQIEKKR